MADSIKELRCLLPGLAGAISGCALLVDADGAVRHLVDHRGRAPARHEGVALFDPTQGVPERVTCPWDPEIVFSVLPGGGGYLCLERGGLGRRIRERFEKALPLIARVAGGEAVLFDRDGTRLMSVDSNGHSTSSYIGQISALARESMATGKPIIGDSTYIVGAKAVRIPVTTDFGLGFNNNDSVAQSQKLIDSIYELRTADTTFADIVGGPALLELTKRLARDAAEADTVTLVAGAKGSGKRMFTQAMHNAGPRRGRPFVTVNCDALDQDLLEGALFGYADAVIRGVMRGRHPGAIVLAEGGTVYLVHIDQMNLQLQAKLYQALSTGKFFPVGDRDGVDLNVRVVAATDKNLEALVTVGRFDRELHRLLSENVISLPSLSAMPEIVPALANSFLSQLERQYGTRADSIDAEAMDILEQQPWPGNAGELRAFLQTVLAGMDDSTVVKKHHLPMGLLGQVPGGGVDGSEEDSVYGMLVRDYEAQVIRHALLVNDGSRLKTAEQLGLSKSSLWRKMKKLGIE